MSSYAKPKPKVQGTINPIQPKLWFTLTKSSYHTPFLGKTREKEREIKKVRKLYDEGKMEGRKEKRNK